MSQSAFKVTTPAYYVVDTDGTGWFYVVPRDDKAFVVQNGAHDSFSSARDHANLLNEQREEQANGH